MNTFYKKHENILLSGLTIAVFGILVSSKYDLIYELNDDTMIRNLLSGSYTGMPTAMNNQMMYLFSAVLSFMYKIIPAIQWFDIFLIITQYGCAWAILHRLIGCCKTSIYKIITAVIYLAFLSTFLLNHFVLMTYTVTSGILGATAIFLFVTEKDNEHLFKKSIISIVLIIIAFCLRSEMMLMLLPFVCVAGIYRWLKEETILTINNFKKYLSIIVVLIISLAVVFITDNIAYSSAEWKDFRSFFDARTTVYDYHVIPPYEDEKEFFYSNNISKEQYLIIKSYDHGLDENINSEMMTSLADYLQTTYTSLGDKLYRAVFGYKEQLINDIGTRYHTLMVIGYIILLLGIEKSNNKRVALMATLIFFTRSVIWLYIIGQGRIPNRITHPLYWTEFALLIAIFIAENAFNIKHGKNIKYIAVPILISIVCVSFVKSEFSAFNDKYNKLYEKAQQYEAVHSYCLKNSENFYFTPVLSMSVYPEMVFDGNKEPTNFDLLGGWLVKSPAHTDKLNNNGLQSIEEGILNKDNVYIIQHSDYISYETDYPFELLINYYAYKGYNVEVIKTDTVIDNIEVYQVRQLN